MTHEIKCIEDQQNDSTSCYPHTLHNVCNWFYPNKAAIEYHDLEIIKIISYAELQTAKEIISNHLKCIQCPEFIGISSDMPEYCVPSLMLGILDSGHAFFNVPSDALMYTKLCNYLHSKYIFMKYAASNKQIMHQFEIHGEIVYLMKLTDAQESIIEARKLYSFAFAIATSGSTGIPKVVKVPHCCILPNITDLKRILGVTKSDKVAQLTSFTFDPCIIEIFLSFCCAATLFMVSKSLKNHAKRLLNKIFNAHITVLQITPSLFFHKWSIEDLKKTILDSGSCLRLILFGGEPFPNMKLLSQANHPQNMTRIFNIYGITEVSCWSSVNQVIKDNGIDESYLGEPLSNTIFQIRNEKNEIITMGEGVLHIGSSSRVCIIDNEIDENFNKPVFRDTGDIVSVDRQGRIFYRGRRNNVIKRFGNKVNLRHLEKVASELNFVQNCTAFWNNENRKLYLCVSSTKNKEQFLDVRRDILTHLDILPGIYKPDKIIVVEHLDFTANGKICFESIKKICRDSESEIINTNNLHTNVHDIFEKLWNDCLKSKSISFLKSGGTSITALQISSATADAFKMEFPELIGMLLKDVMFDECVNYIKRTLTKENWDRNINRCIDFATGDKLSQKIPNVTAFIPENVPADNPTISINKNLDQWYKCKGRIYNSISVQEQRTFVLGNVSNIEVLATYNLQKCVDASPIVYCYSETELFATVGSHFGIICTVNLLESNRIYEVKLPDRIEASVLVLNDFRGIVGCYDGYIYNIHLKTGEIIWKFQTDDIVKCTAITCPQKSNIFVGSYDHHVYCLSVENGTQIWKIKASQSGICATGCLHQQSATVLFGTLDGTCIALRQFTGQVMWKRKLTNPIFVAPVVLKTGYVLFCSVAGTLICFDIETDCQMWQYTIYGNIFSYPIVRICKPVNNEHIILGSHNKNLYYFEMPERTTEVYQPKLRYTLQLHSPIIATSWCEDDNLFVACTDGVFQVINLSQGKLLASKQLPGETFSSPVVHNNLAVLGCRDNNLYVLKLS